MIMHIFKKLFNKKAQFEGTQTQRHWVNDLRLKKNELTIESE